MAVGAKISVIIRARDEERFLPTCLDRLDAQSVLPDEVVLVYDPRSTDRTLEIARCRQLRIVMIDTGVFSYGRALNLGCRAALGDYLVLLSAHAIPAHRKWLSELIEPLLSSDKVGGTFSRQVPHPDGFHPTEIGMRRAFPNSSRNGKLLFSNASGAIARRVWEDQPFNEVLPFCEDLQWAIAVRKMGYHTVYCPKSVVYHSHEESFTQIRSRASKEEQGLCQIGVVNRGIVRVFVRGLKIIALSFIDSLLIARSPRQIWMIFHFRMASLAGFLHGQLTASPSDISLDS